MFKVPEKFRIRDGKMASSEADGCNGAFNIKHSDGYDLFCIASDGLGWEHVSVSKTYGTRLTIPSWNDMCTIKNLFWDDEDCVIQYHPPKSEYVNTCPYALHLWRPDIDMDLPRPPKILVGI